MQLQWSEHGAAHSGAAAALESLLESPRDNKKRDKKSESRSMPPLDYTVAPLSNARNATQLAHSYMRHAQSVGSRHFRPIGLIMFKKIRLLFFNACIYVIAMVKLLNSYHHF